MAIHKVERNREMIGRRSILVAAIAAVLAAAPRAPAATITVDSVADTGAAGVCVLRDAIIAANTKTAIHGCVAGDGNDTIQFGVTGTISLASKLPLVHHLLTINGPASSGIKIDGGNRVQVMQVARGATLNLKNLTIANGFSKYRNRAGGIENYGGTLTVSNSTFSGNRGGGISNLGSNTGTLTVSNSTFSGNSGAGIYNVYNDRATVTIANSTFSGNRGGGIRNIGPMTISNSTFSGNNAGIGGGIFNEGPLTITHSTFSANNAVLGGGILNYYWPMTVTNSTFSGNSASDSGGGIYNDNTFGGTLAVTNSAFAGNSAGNRGGGIFTAGSTTSFKSTILAASSSGRNCSGMITDAGYNISDDTACGFAKTGSANNGDGVDPMLDAKGLQRNGGPTQTIALLHGSPAIDAIPLADCTDQASSSNPIITDQRNFTRPDAEEAFCDIGAFEHHDIPFIRFSSFSGSATINPVTNGFSLSGRFALNPSSSIDPTTQPVALSAGTFALRLAPGSFSKDNSGYVYHETVNGAVVQFAIQFTSTPGSYALVVGRQGGSAPTANSGPLSVTLTIGNNSGTTRMYLKTD